MPDVTVSGSTGPRPTASVNANSGSTSGTTPAPAPTTTPAPAPVSDGFEAAASTRTKKAAEKALGAIGYHPGTVDGRFSANSRTAISAFQKNRGLAVTGELDRKTYDAIRNVEKQAKKGVETAGLVSSGTKKVEARLRRLGYDTGSVDGAYDKKTADAVRAFKADQKMDVNGAMGARARTALKKESAALSHQPHRSRVKNTEAHKTADREAARAARDVVETGDRGAAVRTIQRHLKSAGYDPKSVGGVFDERTAGMVKQFQRASGLEVSGKVGPATWNKLKNAQMASTNATDPTQRKGERSSAVKSTEKMLKKLGFSPGKVDGLYDAKTQRALDKFRKAYHLGGKGHGVGKTTLSKLTAASLRYVTSSQLTRIMPGLSSSRARTLTPHLNRAMVEFGITSKARQAAFLAQVGHESVSLRYFEEIASGSAYEGRADLGNTQRGDGVRYKGRGPIQLTGRANYRNVGRALGLPLEANPTMAARVSVGFRTAGYFWKSRGLNELADGGRGNFDAISVRINGGTNGLQERRDYYARARAVLGV